MMPKRIQMSRQKPWRTDNPEAVIVSRPTKWGNPFKANGSITRRMAVGMFSMHAIDVAPFTRDNIRAELAGKDLACWCPLDQPCHADVLIELANQ